jgi:hypothetical protein
MMSLEAPSVLCRILLRLRPRPVPALSQKERTEEKMARSRKGRMKGKMGRSER